MDDDRVAFLRDRLDEDSDAIRANWNKDGATSQRYHGTPFDPSRAMAEVDAKRRIIADCVYVLEYEDHGHWLANRVLADLALPFRDHPDYRPKWAPEV